MTKLLNNLARVEFRCSKPIHQFFAVCLGKVFSDFSNVPYRQEGRFADDVYMRRHR